MLNDESLGPHLSVEKQFMHDWMHMIFVAGVWNLVILFVSQAVQESIGGNIYTLIKGYLQLWSWPKRLKDQSTLHELFEETQENVHNKGGHFRCSASEGLSLYARI